MIAEKTKQNANYFRIVTILRSLLNSGEISKNEYNRAKAYYKKLTGADISLLKIFEAKSPIPYGIRAFFVVFKNNRKTVYKESSRTRKCG